MTITGTLRSNKREILLEFLGDKSKEIYSSMFGYKEEMLITSYVQKKKINKVVLLLSTEICSDEVDMSSEKRNPEVILHYNKTKGAVDAGDQMTREYTCVRSTRRWPFRLFMEILDTAALNAFIIYTEKYPDFVKNSRSKRKVFLRELSIGLAKNQVARRQQGSKVGLQKPVQYAINLLCPQQLEETPTTSNTNTPPRCNFCPRSLDKKTKFFCTTCRKAVRVTHRRENKRIYCEECLRHQQ
ncbi:Transposase IS4 [Popillia japonica]|uniref:Transposase IS4 n=1 Tax=Popillia japonica TaxID=7064 RepID=A0AAW1MMR8_POPJA